MAKHVGDELKEKFRPQDSALDAEVEAALAGVSLDELYNQDRARPADKTGGETPATTSIGKNVRRGKIVSLGKDEAFVDFGGKSQGIVSLLQWGDELPTVGEEMDFIVDRYDEAEGLLVLSRKGALASSVSWDSLEVGQIVEGTVTGNNKGGLELDIKGMRAFMPAGQVDIYHVPDLSQFVNQKVQVEVTQFDPRAKNLVVSRRNILEREKEEKKTKLMAELAEGQIRRGTVRSVMDFGAFVDLGGADGLLHVSEMTFKRGRQNAAEFVKVGDVLDVKVVKIDKETGKLSLSLKQARGVDPWADADTKYAIGTPVTGRVTKVESFGAFIEVEEGLEGLLPVSEMSYTRIRHPSDLVKEGDTVRLVVISQDRAARRMSFSMKQAGPNPWQSVNDRYHVHATVPGKVTRLADFGAFVELEPGLEGLIHISELANQRINRPADVVQAGQEVSVRILQIDQDNRRIALSLKTAGQSAPAGGAAAAAPVVAAPAKKKKRPELRGGLDWKW